MTDEQRQRLRSRREERLAAGRRAMKMRRRKNRHDKRFLGRWLNRVWRGKIYTDVDEIMRDLLGEGRG